jgi:hypothetical protein
MMAHIKILASKNTTNAHKQKPRNAMYQVAAAHGSHERTTEYRIHCSKRAVQIPGRSTPDKYKPLQVGNEHSKK